MIELKPDPRGTIVPVRAQPSARKEGANGEHAGSLKIAVSAAPERGRANEAIGEVLARALGVRPSQVTIVSGEASRTKRFLVEGIDPEEVARRLEVLVNRRVRP